MAGDLTLWGGNRHVDPGGAASGAVGDVPSGSQNENFRRVYSVHDQFEIGIKNYKTIWCDFSQV